MIIPKIFDRVKQAAPFRNPFLQFWDIIQHKLVANTHPYDYYKFEFYKGGKSWEEKKRYIGRNGSYYWPYTSILLKDMSFLTNKYIAKHLLMGLGLPTPELLAAVGNDYEVRSLETLRASLDSLDNDIVIKPISSARGSDVLVLFCEAGRFRTGSGDEWTAERIWKHVQPYMNEGCLIERRVFNVGQTEKMHPYSLNTFRICTIRTKDGKWHAPSYYMRLGCGKSSIDNIDAGGIQVFLDDKGVAVKATKVDYRRTLSHHPDSGLPLVGFRPEGFDDAIALSLRASHKLPMMGTMGWDIAYTFDGPVIIEGNTLWAAGYQIVSGPVITDEIARGLERRRVFSRYPRDRIFPMLQKKPRWPWQRTRWWA
jgi:hypothetical protein